MGKHTTVIFIRIEHEILPQLAHLAHAGDGPAPFARLVQGGQQHGGEDRDDRNYIELKMGKKFCLILLMNQFTCFLSIYVYMCENTGHGKMRESLGQDVHIRVYLGSLRLFFRRFENAGNGCRVGNEKM
jgi:hypothetical protein